jgi:hypothetical protein
MALASFGYRAGRDQCEPNSPDAFNRSVGPFQKDADLENLMNATFVHAGSRTRFGTILYKFYATAVHSCRSGH